ncbi:MAG TPA: SWIM zinc finger family protein [Actinospica sp.]|nr:SWIM zinc finger family protein [Actinospica sp.]
MALVFTEDELLAAAGPRSFERGLDYVEAVEELEFEGAEINAIVTGTYEYDVTIWRDRSKLEGQCSCPWSQEGNFCKHCVAVGLAALASGRSVAGPDFSALHGRSDLESWIDALGAEELREELRALIRGDRGLRRRFELRAAQAGQDVEQVRKLARQLLGRGGIREPIEYEDAFDYARNVREVAEAIVVLIDKAHAAEAVDIIREALVDTRAAIEDAENSDSDGTIAHAMAQLLPIHLRACRETDPDPTELARHIAEHNLAVPHEFEFAYDVSDYAELLGEAGVELVCDAYRAAYEANPKGWREKQLMEQLVRAGGDLDALVEFLSRDLDSRGYQHLRIAQELEAADRAEEALQWAESGLREATGFIGTDLVEFVALRYGQAGRMDDLLALRRNRFRAEMTVSHYELLRETAERCARWPEERERAMALLHDDLTRQSPKAQFGMGPVLIDILVLEGDYDAAWELSRKAGSEPQRLKLAALIRADRPEEALEVYEQALAPLRPQSGEDTYRREVELLQAIRSCHTHLGTEAAFAAYLAAFRKDQRRKRNLMRLLDSVGLV